MACLPKGRATGAALGRDVTPTDADSSPGSALGLALHPPKRQCVVRAGKLLRSRPMHACNNAAATAEWSASPQSVAWAYEVSMRGTALWVRQRHDLLRGAGSLGARPVPSKAAAIAAMAAAPPIRVVGQPPSPASSDVSDRSPPRRASGLATDFSRIAKRTFRSSEWRNNIPIAPRRRRTFSLSRRASRAPTLALLLSPRVFSAAAMSRPCRTATPGDGARLFFFTHHPRFFKAHAHRRTEPMADTPAHTPN